MRHFMWSACAAFLLAGFVLLCTSPVQAQDASDLFKSKCSICHSADGSGSGPVGKSLNIPDLRSDVVQKNSDGDLIGIVTSGKNKMPAQKDKLTDDQIKQLVSFVRELAKKK